MTYLILILLLCACLGILSACGLAVAGWILDHQRNKR